jgi:hypothetical protein
MTTFSEKYQPVFEVVCRILGNGWRVNKLDNYQHRIKLTSTEIRKYSIIIRLERERFFIVGSVDSLVWHGNPSVCTVSITRNPVGIANDISRKILANALDEIELLREHESALQEKQDKVRIIKGMLSQLLSISPWYGALTGFNADNGLAGKILQNGDDYEMVIRGLNVDQLIKVAVFIKKL